MTTIAWDGRTLAADSLVTSDGHRIGEVRKIGGRNGVAWGGAGCLCDINAFVDWCERGMNGYPPTFLEGKSEAIIVHDETILTWDSNRWDRLTASKYAIGSGRCIALGALEAGATAEQSVAAAIIRDTGSGGPVRAIRVR